MNLLFTKKRNMTELGAWLYNKRMKTKKTCRQLASLLGISRRHYCYLESGQSKMTDAYLENLAMIYGEPSSVLKMMYRRDEVLKAAGWNSDPELAASVIADLNNLLN